MMAALLKDRLFLVLLALLAITLVSWLLVGSGSLDTEVLGALVLVLAFVKVRMIVIHYMEASTVPRPLRLGFEAWVVLVGLMTVALYLR